MYAFSILRMLCIPGILLVGFPSSYGAFSLADALDNTQLIWQSGGDVPWSGQSAFTHDGIDSAQSGLLHDSQESWIQTTVQGPGPLAFWWRVSSELGYDQLQFLIDDIEQVYISGEVDWQIRNFDIPSGTHTLKWRYVKDSSDGGGLDLAWLDQVSYVPPVDFRPIITTPPYSQVVAAGATVSFTVVGNGIPAPIYRWYFNNSLISGATSSALTLDNVTTNYSGSYSVVLSNYLGSVTSSPAILLVTVLADALDAPELTWSAGGAASWFAQSLVTHDGVDATESGSITNFEESWVQTVVRGPGALTFWWKTSSETFYDGLQFLTNGVVVASLSGEAVWEQKTLLLPSGNQSLRWRYFKDGSISMGQDKGWLDEVHFAPNKPPVAVTLSPNSTTIQENDLLTLNGSFVDLDAAEAHAVLVEWGDCSANTTTNLSPGVTSFTFSHRYLDDAPSTVAISATVSDQSGSTSNAVLIQIKNVTPVFGPLTITSPIFPNDLMTVSGDFSDVGSLDTEILNIDWGDGSPTETRSYPIPSSTFSLQHRYTTANTNFALTLALQDDDGGRILLARNIFVMLPSGPVFTSLRLMGAGHAELNLRGTPQAVYQIQASENLKDWVIIGTATAGSDGVFHMIDSDIARSSKRFYQGLWSP
jgi:hypothetical protein